MAGQVDLSGLADGLVELEPGLWVSEHEPSVSYPTMGHSTYVSLEESSYWFRHRNACILALLERFPPEGLLLEIGAGNGFVSRAIEGAGIPVLALEPGPDGVEHARRRGLQPLVRATLEHSRFRPGALDACGMFDVLEHIEDDAGFLAQAHVLLRPGGRLYLTVPAHPLLWSNDDFAAGHVRRYSERALLGVLREAGFEVEYSSAYFAVLVAPILLVRAIPSRLGRRGGSLENRHAREHDARSGWIRTMIDRALDRELRRLPRRPGRIGSSLLAVARKR